MASEGDSATHGASNSARENGAEGEVLESTSPDLNPEDDVMLDISTGIAAAQAGIDLMNRNKFAEAEEMLKPWIHKSIYHSTANSTILFLQAVFSMDQWSYRLKFSMPRATCFSLSLPFYKMRV
jgi:hypothetical protein